MATAGHFSSTARSFDGERKADLVAWSLSRAMRMVIPVPVGTNPGKPNRNAAKTSINIPTNSAASRMDARSRALIVIPVVVGSSRISHPKTPTICALSCPSSELIVSRASRADSRCSDVRSFDFGPPAAGAAHSVSSRYRTGAYGVDGRGCDERLQLRTGVRNDAVDPHNFCPPE